MSGVHFLRDKRNTLFLNAIMAEKNQASEIRAQEILKTQQNPRIRERNILTHISMEMKDMKHEQMLHKKQQQQLWQSSSELHKVECDIQLAKVRKVVFDQCLQMRQQKMRDTQEKHAEAEKCLEEVKRYNEASRMKELEEVRKKVALGEFLECQMLEKKQKVVAQQLEKQREREEMLQIVAQLKDEQLANRKAREERRKVAKKQIEDLEKNKQLHKQQAIIDKIEEQRNYEKMLEEKAEIKRKFDERKQQQIQNQQRISEKIYADIYKEQLKKQRKDEELDNLLVEERIAKYNLRFQEDIDKQTRQRAQLKEECQRYQSEKIVRKNMLKLEDNIVYYGERKAEEEVKEEEKRLNQKRKLALDQRDRILEMIAENKLKRAAQAESDMLYAKTLAEQEKEREKTIAEERLRRLRQESIEVLKFLPNNSLRAEDRKLLGLLPDTQVVPPFEGRSLI